MTPRHRVVLIRPRGRGGPDRSEVRGSASCGGARAPPPPTTRTTDKETTISYIRELAHIADAAERYVMIEEYQALRALRVHLQGSIQEENQQEAVRLGERQKALHDQLWPK